MSSAANNDTLVFSRWQAHNELSKKARPRSKIHNKIRGLALYDTYADIDDLVAVIGKFKGRLQFLTLRGLSFRKGGFDPSFITHALNSGCHNLKELNLALNETWMGRQRRMDMKGLGEALLKMTSLEVIQLERLLDIDGSSLRSWSILIPLLDQPSNVIRKIVIIEKAPATHHDKLNMNKFFTACQSCSKLQELIFPRGSTCIGAPQVRALGQLIRKTSSLKCLEFHLGQQGSSAVQSKQLVSLAESLQQNHSLTELRITRDRANSKGFRERWTNPLAPHKREAAAFCSNLQKNLTLMELEVWPWKRSEESLGEWTQKAQDYRWKLKRHIRTKQANSKQFMQDLSDIFFLLARNKAGKGKLLGSGATNPTTNDWIEAFANQDDLRIIYFFLRSNPSLCSNSTEFKTAGGASGRATKRSRNFLSASKAVGNGMGKRQKTTV